MDFLVKFASAFMGVFQLGGEQFMGWVTGIIPTILMLLVMMNAVIALIGDERIEVIAKVCTSNPLLRYAVLPWLSAFMLGNPMALSMGKFMPEFYKPSYYAAASYHCHTNSGIFPHIWMPLPWLCATCWSASSPTSSPDGRPTSPPLLSRDSRASGSARRSRQRPDHKIDTASPVF